jgi:hypothetical protein
MKVKIDFEIDVDSLSQAMDRINILRDNIIPDFNAAFDELSKEQDEDNFAGKWLCKHYDLEIEL